LQVFDCFLNFHDLFALTPGLTCSPEETNSEADKKPTLWAVSSEPLLVHGAVCKTQKMATDLILTYSLHQDHAILSIVVKEHFADGLPLVQDGRRWWRFFEQPPMSACRPLFAVWTGLRGPTDLGCNVVRATSCIHGCRSLSPTSAEMLYIRTAYNLARLVMSPMPQQQMIKTDTTDRRKT
jgi:hypothetical protein